MTAGLLLLALTFLTPFGFSLAWKRGDLLGVAQRLAVALAGGLVVLVALLAIYRGGPVLAPIAAALAIFVMLGSLSEVVARASRGGARRRRRRLSRARGCRCRSGAARSRISASACCCSASPRPASARRRSSRCASARRSRSAPIRSSSTAVGTRGGPNYQETVAHDDGPLRRRGA